MGEWAGGQGSSDQARADEDDAGSELNPCEVSLGRAVEAASDPTELGQEGVAALHRVADLAHAGLLLATLGGTQAKSSGLGPLLAGLVAVCPVGHCSGQPALVDYLGWLFRLRRL